MALLLLAGLYVLLLPLGFGIWFLRLLRFCLRPPDPTAPVAALTTWLGGLLLLTVLLEMGSLVGPIHTVAHLLAVGIGGAGLAQPAGRQLLGRQLRQARQLPGLVLGLGAALTLCALAVSTMPPINIDTGYYHAQSVRWLEEMGVVPGLANAELHIGFNSAWFVPEALFCWGRYLGSPLQALNMTFFVLFGWYGLAGLAGLLRGRFAPAEVMRCLLAAAMVFWLLDDLPSLSPDPAVTLLVFYLVVQALVLPLPRPGQPLGTAHLAIILLSVFAITVKLSTLPILLLALWWVVRAGEWRRPRFMLVMSALGVLVVGPWLTRNYVISGYLVFPVTALDFFSPSWKFPLAELRLHNDYIKEYARNADFYNQISVHNKPWQFWLPLWWHQQYRANQVLLLAILGLLLTSLPLGWRQYRRGQLPQAPRLLAALAATLAGALFWFLLAPAFRFGYGFLLSTLVLLLLPWLAGAARRGTRPLAIGGAFLVVASMVVSTLAVEYRHYIIAPALNQREYYSLLSRLPADDQAFVRGQFPRVYLRAFWGKQPRPLAERARLVLLLARTGGFVGYSGLDGLTGRSGLLGLPERLLRPAPYPIILVQPLLLPPGQEAVLQNKADKIPWYAPFPFVARRRQCVARGPHLADGFRAQVVPIRDWRREARW